MKRILLTDLRPLDDPGDGWYHIEANGLHPAILEREDEEDLEIIQVLDDEAFLRIAEAGVPEEGVFVDKDHISHQRDKTTEAMSWCRELAVFEDAAGREQLAGWMQYTDLGRPLIKGRIYKHWSTEYDLDDPGTEDLGDNRYRPGRLLGLALTNRPNNKGQRPITNSRRCRTKNTAPQTTMDPLEQIKQKLGLAPETTLEDVLAEIDALNTASAAAAEAEAEAILNSEGLSDLGDEEKKDLKDEIVHNRELGLKMVTLLKNSRKNQQQERPTAPKYARPTDRKPSTAVNNSSEGKDKATGLVTRARAIQKDARVMNRKVSFWKALAQAKKEEQKP